jgi:hypothetical protein
MSISMALSRPGDSDDDEEEGVLDVVMVAIK